MKALLIGYGKMGKLIHTLAPSNNITISAICDHSFTKEDLAIRDGIKRAKSIVPQLLDECDVAIDFCTADGIIERVTTCLQHKLKCVVGTTGWEDKKEEIQKLVKKEHGTLLASSNFSIGVLLFTHLVQHAARLLSHSGNYTASLIETHHAQKKDSPSGTALMLAQELQTHGKHDYEPPIASIRTGNNPGEHVIIFDSAEDTIRLVHQAKSREGFAQGALASCHFIEHKKGYLTLHDMLKEFL